MRSRSNRSRAELPAPTASTVYVLQYPSGTTIDLDTGPIPIYSCLSFGAYHSQASVSGDAGAVALEICPFGLRLRATL